MTPPGDDELRRRVALLSTEQKVRLLTGADFWSLYPEPAAGLRAMVLSDGPAGVRGQNWDERDPSANVPSPTALAATWDTGRVAAIGALLAGEARRKGVDVLLAPTVNLHRTPAGGRSFECFSEDPLLTARIGVAYVQGVQRHGVAATVKHFVCNDSETQRMTARVGALAETPPAVGPADIPRELRAAAAAGFVLARNDGLLPLAGQRLSRVAVIGPNAAAARTLGGGSATVSPLYTISRWKACAPPGSTWRTHRGRSATCESPRPGRPGCARPRSGSSAPTANWPAPSSAVPPCSGG